MKMSVHKKTIAFILLGVVASFGFSDFALAQSQYSDSMDHYSFTLPSGWEEIPKSVIGQYLDEVARQTQGQRAEYSAGFQLAEKDYFQYPYILVQEYDVNTPSYSQLERVFNDNDHWKSVQSKTAEYSELLTSAAFEKPFVDKERNIIFMNIQIDVVNVGRVTGYMVMFLGKQGITQFNFYTVSSEYSSWSPVFNSIVDSFKYETAYAYDPVEAVRNDDSSSLFVDAVTGAATGLMVALFAWVLRGNKSKETGPMDIKGLD